MKEKKRDNRGSALVLVIIAVGFIGMITAMILWMALKNYEMKANDYKIKNSFYSAEYIVDQIRAGLEIEASKAMKTAYEQTMQTYSNYEEAERIYNYNIAFVTEYRKALKSSSTDSQWNLTKIRGFVSPEFFDGSNPDAVVDCSVLPGNAGYCLMESTNASVVLRNLRIEFTDTNGYVSIIETDIRMNVPAIDFTQTSDLPEIFYYSLIADESLNSATTAVGDSKITGNIYAGEGGININNGARWASKDADYVITRGDINLIENSGLETSKTGQLWAKGIGVDQSVISLEGCTFISDDLTISGEGSQAAISNKYYGYGNSTEGNKNSSAILINGTKTTLDLSQLDTLVVAGHSYIGTEAVTSPASITTDEALKAEIVSNSAVENHDVFMGESISVKGNQIAYMVPAECIGVDKETGKSLYDRNPLTYEEYSKISDNEDVTEVSFQTLVEKLGTTLEPYLDTSSGRTVESQYRKIFVPNGGSGEGQVYYYLNFSEEQANTYFQNYYNADSSTLEKYKQVYLKDIQSKDDMSRIVTAGNSFIEETPAVLKKQTEEQTARYAEELSNYGEIYKNLTLNLKNSNTDLSEADYNALKDADSVFDNVIDTKALNDYISNEMTGTTAVFSTGAGGAGHRAMIVANADGDPYVYDGTDANLHMILATGDVEVAGNFSGIIISKKKITVMGPYDITRVSNELFTKLMKAKLDEYSMYQFFKDGSLYITYRIAGSSDKSTDANVINISDTMTYENWTKE